MTVARLRILSLFYLTSQAMTGLIKTTWPLDRRAEPDSSKSRAALRQGNKREIELSLPELCLGADLGKG